MNSSHWQTFLFLVFVVSSNLAAIARAGTAYGETQDAVESVSKRKLSCKNPNRIPFMIAVIEGEHGRNNKLWLGHDSDEYPQSVYFLKNVKCCDGEKQCDFSMEADSYQVVGTKVSARQFKRAVRSYLNRNGQTDVLYHINGFATSPMVAFWGAYEYNKKEKNRQTQYLMIPIAWRTSWENRLYVKDQSGFKVAYERDRNDYAINAGKLLAKSANVFNANYPTHIMNHSMGNWVFRNFVQAPGIQPKKYFKNIFMVAADSRCDMFSTNFNPDAPRERGDERPSWHDGSYWRCRALPNVPYEECKKNGGYAMTQFGDRIHVIWNENDVLLHLREALQLGVSSGFRQAIGKYGNNAQDYVGMQYFRERVTFHDFTPIVGKLRFEDSLPIQVKHLYQLEDYTVDLYVEYRDI